MALIIEATAYRYKLNVGRFLMNWFQEHSLLTNIMLKKMQVYLFPSVAFEFFYSACSFAYYSSWKKAKYNQTWIVDGITFLMMQPVNNIFRSCLPFLQGDTIFSFYID